jgi:hypothetical protein
VFTATLRSKQRDAVRLGSERHGTVKTPFSLLLRNRRVYGFLWLKTPARRKYVTIFSLSLKTLLWGGSIDKQLSQLRN